MATLADTFLEDLDDLDSSDDEGVQLGPQNEGMQEGSDDEDGLSLEDQLGQMEEEESGVSAVASLKKSDHFKEHMIKVGAALENEVNLNLVDEFDPEYRLVVESNAMLKEVQDEIFLVHKYLVELYSKKFPELDQLVPNPLQFADVVKRIGNEMDMTLVDFDGTLPQAQKMVVSVTGSTTSGQELTETALKQAMEAADEINALDESRVRILSFVESRMNALAPNTSAILGTTVTARLLGHVGGITALSRMPSCNLQVLGATTDEQLAGFSSAATAKHTGLIYECELVMTTPPHLRRKLCRVIAGKVALAVRADTCGAADDRSGELGESLREQIVAKIEKWLEPPKAKTKKALAAPDSRPRRKRGGRRVRSYKEKRAMTDTRAQQNRVIFHDLNDEYGDSAMGRTFGALGKGGVAGSLRMTKKEKKQAKKRLQRKVNYGSSGATSGLASSLAFTPVQGIELINPDRLKAVKAANASYFGEDAGFTSTIKRRRTKR